MKRLIFVLIVFILIILGLSAYLDLDDLRDCGLKPDSTIGCQAVDVIVVVSGGNTKARVEEAVKLYKNGWSKKLIFSGAAQDKTSLSNAAEMKIIATQAGVPALSIWLDEYSDNTQQNAQNTKTIFRELDTKQAILVTSGYHQRRASLEFMKRIQDVKILNHSTTVDPEWSAYLWWLTPRGWWLMMSELTKIIIFYITQRVVH